MITLFSEEDLVSFGAYMVSQERYEYIKAESADVSEDELLNRLGQVNQIDIANWIRNEQKAMQQTKTDE